MIGSGLRKLAREHGMKVSGGVAYGSESVEAITKHVGWIAPITVYPGEDELLALTQGALRVLKGEEKLMEY